MNPKKTPQSIVVPEDADMGEVDSVIELDADDVEEEPSESVDQTPHSARKDWTGGFTPSGPQPGASVRNLKIAIQIK